MSQLSTPLLPRAFPKIVVFLVLIGLAAAARRAYVLLVPPHAPRFARAADLDSGFAAHRLLTFIHILPASLVIVLMPLQFVGRIRQRRPAVHRWSGRIAIMLGLVVGGSALVMSQTMAIGGANEAAATTLFALLFLLFLGLGFRDTRQGRIGRHREWMIRAFGVLLGIATTRPVVAAFFAAGRLSPHEFFGTAFWLGFTLTLLAAEAWIHSTSGLSRQCRYRGWRVGFSPREASASLPTSGAEAPRGLKPALQSASCRNENTGQSTSGRDAAHHKGSAEISLTTIPNSR